jgi:hypothetical protein
MQCVRNHPTTNEEPTSDHTNTPEIWLQKIQEANISSQNSLGIKSETCSGLRRFRTPKQPTENPSKRSQVVPQPKHLIASDPRTSKIMQDVVLRMTLNSAQDFLCTAKSSLMSSGGQNRIFHHVLLPIRDPLARKVQSPRVRPIEDASPRILPDTLTVLAMASRKRRMHLARCPRSTLEASSTPPCRAILSDNNMRAMRSATPPSLSSAELSVCSAWD